MRAKAKELDLQVLYAVGGQPVKAALAAVERSRRIKAILVVIPLFLFILIISLYLVALMLFHQVDNPLINAKMLHILAARQNWDWKELPPEHAFAAAAKDLDMAR